MCRSSIVLCLLLIGNAAIAQQKEWSEVEKVFGKNGNVQDNVFKITFPRSDLKVKVSDFSVAPGLALTSWIGMMKMDNEVVMMGDLVLLDKEVAPVISKLVSEGVQITALHNHIVGETPTVKYLHFSARGDAISLAGKIKMAIAITGTPLTAPQPQIQTVKPDWSKVEAILGTSGKSNGDLLQYSFARNEKLTESGMEMPPSMGMATGINFQKAGDKAAIAGDFVLLADEVYPVIQALTVNEIHVTAIHNHMLYDSPRLFMLHFWAVGDPGKLAKGLKEAIGKTNSRQ